MMTTNSELVALAFADTPGATTSTESSSHAGHTSWIARLFSFHRLTAVDYVGLLVAAAAAGAVYYFYYRRTLPRAVEDMETPSRIKLRAAGLAVASFAVLAMLSPMFPGGWFLVLLGALALAYAQGLSPQAAALVGLCGLGAAILLISGILPHSAGR